ncbi:FtsW/RodA/SpoVE family cell cycle protein [Coprococcus sp. AF21-14LB]|uniref:FtsW/RodA/SpoVE family cell cycle protein n=1 Tax=Coprococcus sp. AF21-14LB TaxID=2292231 RepID=UPI000E4AD5E7|nr:putative peptidoglycan glycosyltransferase FtsW [Coprococcus sp. AF21-14LB]RGS79861.1 cell division protein FtsW [Coprococcus sp. AF21-14LB]
MRRTAGRKPVSRRKKQPKTIQYFDYSLLATIIFLVCFGLVILYSTSAYSAQEKFNDPMWYFRKQAIITVGSLIVMAIVSRINYHVYARFAKLSYVVAFILMLLILTPFGIEANGARRWVGIPDTPLQIQPAEVVKIAVILYIPFLVCRTGKYIEKWDHLKEILIYGGAAGIGVLILTDNLSSAIIVLGITAIILYVSYPRTKKIVQYSMLAGIVGYIGVRLWASSLAKSDNFRLQRIIVWINPEKHAGNKGFQTLQALYAIGSGGFFGKGLGASTQKMIIPEVQNDMILSIICEELGVFGAIVVLVMFGMMLYRLMFIAQNAPDKYGSLIVTGIFAHIAIQVILNVAVVTNLIPNTGITLPFISYGGTSILFLMIEMGMALSVSRSIRFDES